MPWAISPQTQPVWAGSALCRREPYLRVGEGGASLAVEAETSLHGTLRLCWHSADRQEVSGSKAQFRYSSRRLFGGVLVALGGPQGHDPLNTLPAPASTRSVGDRETITRDPSAQRATTPPRIWACVLPQETSLVRGWGEGLSLGVDQFSSVQLLSRPTLGNPMDCNTPGLSVHHQLPELTQTHVH